MFAPRRTHIHEVVNGLRLVITRHEIRAFELFEHFGRSQKPLTHWSLLVKLGSSKHLL